MKKTHFYIFSFLISLFTIGCEDLIVVDVPEGDTKLVVEALLYSTDSIHQITLSNSAPYFDKNQTPRISGALVYIMTNNGDSVGFRETGIGSGRYTANFKLEEGKTYFLNILTAQGRIYRSLGEKLLRVSPLELYQSDEILDSIQGFRPQGYYVSIRTVEPAGIGDFYRWIININGEQQLSPQYFWIADDRLVDGNVIEEFPQFFVYGMMPGDSVSILQTSISARAYNFWYLLQEQVFNSGGPFDTPPGSPEGNVISLSDPNEIVLGYFSVSNAREASITVRQK
ncbi:MAG: DUF4249 domain-containing protein [Vicingaceae bacterium]